MILGHPPAKRAFQASLSAAIFVTIAAGLTLAQQPPPEAATGESGKMWLIPGLPMRTYKPDSSQSPVGFLDSGIQADHPQLNGLVVAARDFTGEGLQDDFEHGTVVALVFVKGFYDNGDKAPPGIISAKVVGKNHVSTSVMVRRMIMAIRWLASQHVKLVNISMALTGEANVFAPLCKTIRTEKQILFGVAAGNGGAEQTAYPADCDAPNKLTTGAVDSSGRVANYSGKAELYSVGDVELVDLVEYYRLQGDRLEREGKYDTAKISYDQALALSPSLTAFAKIKYGVGVVAYKTDKQDEALEDFRAAVKAAPEFAEAYVAASTVLTNQGNLEAAVTLLKSGLGAGADSAGMRDRLARVLLDLDRPREAQAQIDALNRLDPIFPGSDDLMFAAHNRIVILDRLEKGDDPQMLFWTILDGADGGLVLFLTHSAKLDVNAIPVGAQVPPIVRAAGKGQTAVVTALLRAGAKVDACNSGNRITALMAAANAGEAAIVQMLVQAGASIDAADDFGFTPLMFTAEEGRLECAKILIKYHANLSLRSHEGKSALDYALEHRNGEIAAAIENETKAQRPVP